MTEQMYIDFLLSWGLYIAGTVVGILILYGVIESAVKHGILKAHEKIKEDEKVD